MHLKKAIFVGFLAIGCSKTDDATKPSASTSPSDVPTFSIVGTPASAASSVAAADSAVPSASAASSATPVATTSASAGKNAKLADAGAAPLPPLKAAASHITGKNFALDLASPGCRVDSPCAVTIRLATGGDYHINKEYPYKFIATPAGNVTYLGSSDANTFSRAAGDFKEDGEKAGTMTVRFKPTSAGDAKVTGTYKMSVCSAENCQIEQQALTLAVPVM